MTAARNLRSTSFRRIRCHTHRQMRPPCGQGDRAQPLVPENLSLKRSMHYEERLRFRRWELEVAPPPLCCAVQGFAPLPRR
jgi:hypothetical protein